jgi:Protein of unknown function (DUF1552)
MIITGKHLPRRTFLRGVGATIALPWLDAMVPAFAAAAQAKAPVRLVFVYTPNGMIMDDWTPKQTGNQFELPRILKPLEPFRDDLLVLTGLHHTNGTIAPGDHAAASATYLTGVAPKRTTGGDVQLGVSVDQLAAQAIGNRTPLPSLELSCEASRPVGNCDGGFACAYINNLSWRDSTTPVPPEANPRAAFERLFGGFDTHPDPAVRERIKNNRTSMLDAVTRQTQQLLRSLGASDRRKLDEYMTALRDIEQRITRVENQDREVSPDMMEKPLGIPAGFVEHARLMNDVLAVALQADITRTATLIYAKEGSSRAYPELGFADAHHPLTHHRNRQELIEKVTQIECHHMEQFAGLVKTLRSMPEGDGTVLDHSMVVYGSSMSDPNRHVHEDVPCVMLGRGDGSVKTGRHIVYPQTPQTNLWLTLLDRMGVRAEKLGDSDGKLEQLGDI